MKIQTYDKMFYEGIEHMPLSSILYIFANNKLPLGKVVKQKFKNPTFKLAN